MYLALLDVVPGIPKSVLGPKSCQLLMKTFCPAERSKEDSWVYGAWEVWYWRKATRSLKKEGVATLIVSRIEWAALARILTEALLQL
jgi:hypothetical protein